jgi:hypothetical protein
MCAVDVVMAGGETGSLADQCWAQAMFHLDLLEERGVLPGEP